MKDGPTHKEILRHFEFLLDAAVITYDPASKEHYISPNVLRLLGFNDESLSLTDLPAYIASHDRRKFLNAVRRFDGSYTTAQFPVIRKDGEKRCFRFVADTLRLNGQALFVVACHDVTQQSEALVALEKKESLLREAEKIGKMGSWERNQITGELIWSEGMYRIFGMKQGEKKPSTEYYIRTYVHADDQQRVETSIREMYEKGVDAEIRYRIRRRDGSQRIILSQPLILRDRKGKPVILRGIVRDITEEARLQEEKLAAGLDRQKELLNAVMQAQEEERLQIGEGLHNNLGQLLFAIRLQAGQLGNASDPAIARMQTLLEQAISLTRNISSELTPTLIRDYGMRTAIRDMISQRSSSTGINIKASFTGNDLRVNPADETAVFRIVQELLNNTIKHANATEISLSLRQKDTVVRLVYSDNGKGYDFSSSQKGSGFGLRSIRNRVELMSGKLTHADGRLEIELVCRPAIQG